MVTGADKEEPGEDAGDEQELYEHHRITADPRQGLLRLDKFLAERMAGASRTRVAAAIRNSNDALASEMTETHG